MIMSKSGSYRFLNYMRGLWLGFAAGGLMSAVSEAGVQLALALLLSAMVNSTAARDSQALLRSILTYGMLIAVMAVLLPIARRLCAKATETAGHRWREAAFSQLQSLPLSFVRKHPAQDIVSRVTADISVAVQFLGEELVGFVAQVAAALVAVAAIALIDARFMMIPVVVVGAAWLVNRVTEKPLHRLSGDVQAGLAHMSSGLSELVQGQVAARSYGFSHILNARFGDRNDEYCAVNMRLVRLKSVVTAINNFLGAASFLGVVSFGSILLLRQEISFGEVVALSQFSQVAVRPFRSAGSFWSVLQQSLAASARVFMLLDAPREQLAREKTPVTSDAAISFTDVSFSYGEQESPALDGLTFHVPKGVTIAFVGESGGGKSTIFKLLLGLYEPRSGAISVHGRSLADYELQELRGLFSYVPQDATLFSGTIYDNITCGRDDVPPDEVMQAARAAHALEFISSLELGMKSEVGERGGNLSGGQRQRIAIARAILRNAPILLLDEATASIDTETEKLVLPLMAGRTTLLIAHRLTTAREADLIFVLAGGKIVERGSHDELMLMRGHYRRLYAAAEGSSLDTKNESSPITSQVYAPALAEIGL